MFLFVVYIIGLDLFPYEAPLLFEPDHRTAWVAKARSAHPIPTPCCVQGRQPADSGLPSRGFGFSFLFHVIFFEARLIPAFEFKQMVIASLGLNLFCLCPPLVRSAALFHAQSKQDHVS